MKHQAINTDEFLGLFKRTFRGRQDVVPEKYEDGWSIICQNKFEAGVCRIKPKVKKPCENCPWEKHAYISDDLIKKHFNGDHFLGVYPLLLDETCNFIAADFDNHDSTKDPLKDVKALYEACEYQDLPMYLFRSKSGKGFHSYLFFDSGIPAWKARMVMDALLEEARLKGEEVEKSSFCSMYPSQDRIPGKDGVGSLIALPFQGKAMEQGNTLFLDPKTGFSEPFADQLAVLKDLKRVSEAELDRLISEWNLKPKKQASTKPHNPENSVTNGDDRLEKVFKCDFLLHAYQNQSEITEPLWYAMLTNVSRIGQGATDLCHEFSRQYPKYSRQETDAKILQAMNASPHTCEYIKGLGFDCGKDCGVKAPIVLVLKGARRKEIPQLNLKTQPPAPVQDREAPIYHDPATEYADRRVKKALPEAPVSGKLIIPPNWELSMKGGLVKVSVKRNHEGEGCEEETEVAPVPVLISGRMIDMETGDEIVSLVWYRDNAWVSKLVEREKISRTADITKLAAQGFPSNSLNAKPMVEYLADFEAANIKYLPKGRISKHLGWQKNLKGFLLGNTYFSASGEIAVEGPLDFSSEAWPTERIVFRGQDNGNDQVAKGYSVKGSYSVWLDCMNQLHVYPRVVSAMYFSIAAPLLSIIDAPNFTVDWSYSTSTGKTTALRVGVSVWGNPDENSSETGLHTWNSTTVSIGRIASMLNGLPFFLDDTKLAGAGKNRDIAASSVVQTLYNMSSGQDRSRGSLHGLQQRGSWRTILLTNGEQSAVDFTHDGGSRGRAVTLWGSPFGKTDEETGLFVSNINRLIKQNHGHAGRLWIEYILKNRQFWPEWKSAYQANIEKYAKLAGNNSIAARVSEFIAVLATVIPIAQEALPGIRTDIDPEAIVNPIWASALAVADDSDRATVALRVLYSWAATNQSSFWGRHQEFDGDPRPPNGGWAGSWKRENWEFIAFDTGKAKRILKDEGFDVESILKTFKDRDWLSTDRSGRGKNVRIQDVPTTCYCIRKSIIDKIIGDSTEGD